jgi:DNA-binding transcriptional LysR family regulator
MRIDIRLLRQVFALSKHRNFARAAESLHISQPALSRSIAGLEQSLGVQLFDRTPGGVEPTKCGQAVIDRGHEILQKERELRREIFLIQGIEVGELSIGAGPFPFEISVSDAVARLITRYPRLQIRIDKDSPPAIVNRVLTGDIDIGVADIRHCEEFARLSVELLPEHAVACCCRRGHPLAGRRSLSLDDLLDFPIVGTVMPPALAALLSRNHAAGRVNEDTKNFHPAITVDSLSAARNIALGCDALLPITLGCIARELESGDLVILDFKAPWMRNQYGFISRKGRTHSPAAMEFMARMREVEEEAIELEARLFATYSSYSDTCGGHASLAS